jgi:outer membrane protein assembly factor BamB
MAFEVRLDTATSKPMLVPLWTSRALHAPDVPVVANGVVYTFQSGKDSTETRAAGAGRGGTGRAAGAGGAGRGAGAGRGNAGATAAARPASIGTNAILYAFDAETGKQLFSSELDSFNHFTNPVVAGGNVYAVTWDGKLYAFGLKK